jgi:hypothetical protein
MTQKFRQQIQEHTSSNREAQSCNYPSPQHKRKDINDVSANCFQLLSFMAFWFRESSFFFCLKIVNQ